MTVHKYEPSAGSRVALSELFATIPALLAGMQNKQGPEYKGQRPSPHTPMVPDAQPPSKETEESTVLPPAEPSSKERPIPSSDTLRTSTAPGTPLILSLPATLNDIPVTRYSVLQGPSLSGVANRSLTWIPDGVESGPFDVQLHAHHPDTAPDTLVVRISVNS